MPPERIRDWDLIGGEAGCAEFAASFDSGSIEAGVRMDSCVFDSKARPGWAFISPESRRKLSHVSKTATMIEFRAKVHRPAAGGEWSFLRLPQEASDRLPTRSQSSVEGTFGGHAFAATLQPDGEGGHWLKIDPVLARAVEARVGDTYDIQIAPVAVEPEAEVPADWQAALDASPEAKATWLKTTAVARRDWIQWLGSGEEGGDAAPAA